MHSRTQTPTFFSAINISRLVLAFFSILVYKLCMPRGITWLNFGTDGAELLAAALSDGVAHPSGYPLYTWILRGLALIPVELALIANLLSAVLITASGQMLFLTLANQAEPSTPSWVVGVTGLLAAASFQFAPLVWAHATVSEVYPLHLFLLSLLIWMSTRPVQSGTETRRDLAIGLIFGLGLANHLTILFAFPFVVQPTRFINHDRVVELPGIGYRHDLRSAIRRLGVALIMAFGFYGSLLLTDPTSAVRWHDPQNLGDLIDLISGAIYQPYFSAPNDFTFSRLLALPGWLVEQLGAFGLFLGLWGAVYLTRPTWRDLSLIILALSSVGFSLLYPIYDSYVHLLPFLFVSGLWIGLGLLHLLHLAKGSKAVIGLLVVFTLNLGYLIAVQWNQVDASDDTKAKTYAMSALTQAPQNAVILASDDRTIFPLWYYHDGLGERPDLMVIAQPLARTTWYQRSIRRVMPMINIPTDVGVDFWREANPNLTICLIKSAEPLDMDCGDT